jgi:hypothetical protein
MLTQLDVYRLAGMFWYALVMEIPRFTLGLVVVSGCFLLRPRHPAAVIPRNTRISVLFPGHNEGSALRQAVTALGSRPVVTFKSLWSTMDRPTTWLKSGAN